MKLETFFEKFDRFADAPDAVAKIRELILESAIRGNLVPHNASDEPASALLRRIETLSSVQGGKVRKQAAFPPVGDDAYLQIPPGWEWTRLGNTGRIFNGDSVSEIGKAELAKVEDGLPFIATKDVGYGRDTLVYDNGLKVPLGDPRFKVARAKAVLICAEGGSAGRKIGITDRDICFGNKLYANEVWEGIHHRYIFYIYQAPTFFREFAARMTGIIGGIARSEFLSLPIPFPPEQEQKRIVAKVDELMALCDRLALQQQERETRHAALARASLARFADAPTPANLPFLFHPSYAIPPADLRKSILTLAVQGKLVPQDPTDEPAEALFDRIQAERAEQEAKGAYKSSRPLEPIDETEEPFTLPVEWKWARLRSLVFTLGDGLHGTPEYSDGTDCYFINGNNLVDGRIVIKPHTKTVSLDEAKKHRKPMTLSTVLVSINGTLGSVAFYNNENVILGKSACYFNLASLVDKHFARRVIESPYFVNYASENATGTTIRNLGLKAMNYFPFPLPPLTEQRRIVVKVEQLMALVDELETQLASSRATAEKLLEAVVAELTTQD